MRTTRVMLLGALGVMLGAFPVGSAAAQADLSNRLPGYGPAAAPAAELFYTRLSMDSDGPRLDADGFGGRLTWSLASATGSMSPLTSRTEFGVFATYTPLRKFGSALNFSTTTLGADVGVRPFAQPLLGRIDPFVNVGAGLLRVDRKQGVRPSPTPLVERSGNWFTLAPSAGARFYITPALSVQGDVRDFMTFRQGTRHNVAVGAGLRLGF